MLMKDVHFTMNSVDVDRAVKYVKTIVENCRCVMCDGLAGDRVRYPCGHSVCENCVLLAENCLLCLTPPQVSSYATDGPRSLRVQHSKNLLNCFQDVYELDVYRRSRASEQLQLEKQIFPECIQAPVKYSNTRRNSSIQTQNKENLNQTVFPGENTSTPNVIKKMENKMSYVQQWLSKNETNQIDSKQKLPRKPFTDIHVNRQNATTPKRSNTLKETKVNKTKKTNRSKTHAKSSNTNTKNKSKLSLKRKINDAEINTTSKDLICTKIKCNKHESGIVLDDEFIIIEDSQESLDKDKQAWLAVLEADRNCPCDNTTTSVLSEQLVKETNPIEKAQFQNVGTVVSKIPFYKKGPLCNYVNNDFNKVKNTTIKNTSKTFTLDNNNFVATITVSEDTSTAQRSRSKYSIGIQTEDDFCNVVVSKSKANENSNFNVKNLITTADTNPNNNKKDGNLSRLMTPLNNRSKPRHPVRKTKCVIVDESDTDSELGLPPEKDSLLEVTAEVHRSENEIECSALSELLPEEYENRGRPAVRGHTPTSTDSSDKENYDPNRAKRYKLDKKHCAKKY